jgi:A/G-specific adenine glycosylase
MPGMWELPELNCPNLHLPVLRLRHAIMNTDIDVQVFRTQGPTGKWVPVARLPELPLTGLARKILRRAGLLA